MTLGLTQYSDKSTQAYYVKLSSDSSRYLNNPGIDHLPTQVTLMKWKHLDVETIQTFKTQASQTDDDVLCLPEIPIATEWRYNTRNVGCQTETRKIVHFINTCMFGIQGTFVHNSFLNFCILILNPFPVMNLYSHGLEGSF